MKRLLIFFAFFLLFPSRVLASEDWVIENFQSEISILQDGRVSVKELISVDFGTLSKHGIYRDLPYIYQSETGEKTYSEVTVESVLRNNLSNPYKISKEGGFLRLKIGDLDVTVSEKQEYEITYLVKGISRAFSTYDELYWNVTGNTWPVPILKSSAKVALPGGEIKQIICFEGKVGGRDLCQANQVDQKEAVFHASKKLAVGEGLTLAVAYTSGLVPILTVEPPKTLETEIFKPLNFVVFGLSLLFGIMGIFWLWFSKGRDFWWRKKHAFDTQAVHEVKPLDAYETIVVEFTPPENLRPAEIGTLMDERADTLDVSSTIVDLASRGFLTIGEEEKKWIFGKKDYLLTKKEKDVGGLLTYEKELLARLFEDGDIVYLSKLKRKFYQDLKEVKKKLYEEMIAKKFFAQDPEKVRNKYLLFGLGAIFVAGVMIFFGIFLILGFILAAGGGLAISGLLLAIFSRVMPRRTAHGREVYRRLCGFELFIRTAEKYRQQFFERKNLFNEVLPYAIVFGLTKKFAQAFKALGIEPQAPAWYVGPGIFNAQAFSSNVDSFSSSLSSAIAATPGGSGFSSGGGFSGGGFGGGGGGSW